MIYIFIFFLILLASFIELHSNKRGSLYLSIVYWTIGLGLILFAGLRTIGYDYLNYQDLFNTVTLSNYIEKLVEVGIAFFMQLFRVTGLPFNSFLFFVALITISLRLYTFKKLSPYPILSLLIYFTIGFLINEMGQIRNGLAFSVVMLGYYYLFIDRIKFGFVLILFACLFHFSAFVVLPAFFFCNGKWRLKPLLATLIIIAFLPFVLFDIKEIALRVADKIPFFHIQSKLIFYAQSDEYGKRIGFGLTFVLRIIILVLLYFYEKAGAKKYPYYHIITKLYFVGIVIFMIFNSIAEFAIRFSNYFKMLEYALLPIFISLSKGKFEKYALYFGIVLYAFWSIYKILVDPISSVSFLPYKSILDL